MDRPALERWCQENYGAYARVYQQVWIATNLPAHCYIDVGDSFFEGVERRTAEERIWQILAAECLPDLDLRDARRWELVERWKARGRARAGRGIASAWALAWALDISESGGVNQKPPRPVGLHSGRRIGRRWEAALTEAIFRAHETGARTLGELVRELDEAGFLVEWRTEDGDLLVNGRRVVIHRERRVLPIGMKNPASGPVISFSPDGLINLHPHSWSDGDP